MDEKQESKAMSFEERLALVQGMTSRIEAGSLPLEDAVKEYEKGMKILSQLDEELSEMNRRLTVLQNGKETAIPDENI
ncbi:MAG: exodeoxyribonuclease VII small subunit [Clostridia bacterium]|nr:exodeoxyribonuclease VII small subunit [Clostridia bacterium]